MQHDIAPGFTRISGKRRPPDNGPFYIQLRCGFVDLRIAYTRDQLRWVHDGEAGDIIAIKWNEQNAGKIAGVITPDLGYVRLTVMRQKIFAHRAAFAMMIGRLPAAEVDHINGLRADNRWVNLREVTALTNRRNMALSARNTSGIMGVNRHQGKWRAYIRDGKKDIHLGEFVELEHAVIARKAAERALGFHPNHGRRSPHIKRA